MSLRSETQVEEFLQLHRQRKSREQATAPVLYRVGEVAKLLGESTAVVGWWCRTYGIRRTIRLSRQRSGRQGKQLWYSERNVEALLWIRLRRQAGVQMAVIEEELLDKGLIKREAV